MITQGMPKSQKIIPDELKAILNKLPEINQTWDLEGQERWLGLFNATIRYLYPPKVNSNG